MKIGGNTLTIIPKYQLYFILLTGLCFAVVICLFEWANGAPIQWMQLLFQTTLFTAFWYLVMFRLKSKGKEPSLAVLDNQSVIFYGVAHQLIKTSTTVGVLYATDKQLFFEPRSKEFISSTWTLDWTNIENVEYESFLTLYNDGIRIQTKGGMTFKFAVNQPQVWIESMRTKMKL